MIRVLLLLLLFCSGLNSLEADMPRAFVKFRNAKIDRALKRSLDRDWTFFTQDNSEILYNKSEHKYKNDQFCRFTFETDSEHKIIDESIKLAKHKQNFAYNLKAIEFLRSYDIVVQAKKKSEPIEVDFCYKAF